MTRKCKWEKVQVVVICNEFHKNSDLLGGILSAFCVRVRFVMCVSAGRLSGCSWIPL